VGKININGQEYPYENGGKINIGNMTGGAFAIGNHAVVRSYNYSPAKSSTAPSGMQLKPGVGFVDVLFDGHCVKFQGEETLISDLHQNASETQFSIGGVLMIYRKGEGKIYLKENNVELTSATAGVFRSKGVEVFFVY
jgi:hypothetical protein